jgi:Tol biopolymer transport system component
MPRVADVLERESRTVALAPGDFERLCSRRERKQRNRRIRAGALGFIIVLATGLFLARSLTWTAVPADQPTPATEGTLVYVRDGDVFLADQDGGHPVKVADGLTADACAAADAGVTYWSVGSMWSPDGRYFAYRRSDCPAQQARDVVISDASGKVLATFPADGWGVTWSPDSSRIAVWDTTFETVGVYGVDGSRQASIDVPSSWATEMGDHDPVWLHDGTLAIDELSLPLDGSPAEPFDTAANVEYQSIREGVVVSPDGTMTARVGAGGSLIVEGSDGVPVKLFIGSAGGPDRVLGFSPGGDQVLFVTDYKGVDLASGGPQRLWAADIGGRGPIGIASARSELNGQWFAPSRIVTPDPTRAPALGEVLTVPKYNLLAQDPSTGAVRTLVETWRLPKQDLGAPTGAAWSYDRDRVAFRSYGGGLWIVDGAGGVPRQVAGEIGSSPWAWSPTDDRLVLVQGREVTLVDASTGGATPLGTVTSPFDNEGYAVNALDWSADGTKVAYDGGSDNGTVSTIDVVTGAHAVLIPRPAGVGAIQDIDWSPDGTHIAIAYEDPAYAASQPSLQSKATALYIANADGSDVRLVEHIAAGHWPVWMPRVSVGTQWSPDGSRLAFTTLAGPGLHEMQLWTVGTDGAVPSLVTTVTGPADGGRPVWSPDGSRIAFEVEPDGDGPSSYVFMNADGTGEQGTIDEVTYRSWDDGWFFCFCYG